MVGAIERVNSYFLGEGLYEYGFGRVSVTRPILTLKERLHPAVFYDGHDIISKIYGRPRSTSDAESPLY